MPEHRDGFKRAFGSGGSFDGDGQLLRDNAGRFVLKDQGVAEVAQRLASRDQVSSVDDMYAHAVHSPPSVALKELDGLDRYQRKPRGERARVARYAVEFEDFRQQNPTPSLEDAVKHLSDIVTATGTRFAVELIKVSEFVPGASPQGNDTVLVVVLLVALRGQKPDDAFNRRAATTKELGRILDLISSIGTIMPFYLLVLEACVLPGEDQGLFSHTVLEEEEDGRFVQLRFNPRSALTDITSAPALRDPSAEINSALLRLIKGDYAVVLSSRGAQRAWNHIEKLLPSDKTPVTVEQCAHLSLNQACKAARVGAVGAFSRAIGLLNYSGVAFDPGAALADGGEELDDAAADDDDDDDGGGDDDDDDDDDGFCGDDDDQDAAVEPPEAVAVDGNGGDDHGARPPSQLVVWARGGFSFKVPRFTTEVVTETGRRRYKHDSGEVALLSFLDATAFAAKHADDPNLTPGAVFDAIVAQVPRFTTEVVNENGVRRYKHDSGEVALLSFRDATAFAAKHADDPTLTPGAVFDAIVAQVPRFTTEVVNEAGVRRYKHDSGEVALLSFRDATAFAAKHADDPTLTPGAVFDAIVAQVPRFTTEVVSEAGLLRYKHDSGEVALLSFRDATAFAAKHADDPTLTPRAVFDAIVPQVPGFTVEVVKKDTGGRSYKHESGCFLAVPLTVARKIATMLASLSSVADSDVDHAFRTCAPAKQKKRRDPVRGRPAARAVDPVAVDPVAVFMSDPLAILTPQHRQELNSMGDGELEALLSMSLSQVAPRE
ncbi:hypothetical protein AURANDRAFT_68663 [Aureococcus anophagefferens]|uniref:Uncharacterized protein n=1 Tax=Aureococcus anophagefferens TaxID=44056 RepID=F0YQC9_AURAN|nr:hypothetical protein AURANDRAFT_68663 [Aureococcus anophagefferens]EGB02680.1 hypothetical protein AURANDRAFT_68663 [Aureococcus anophagefferens]|eukprot:XP_009042620.1 hypothetical protein AURANDRAFT_68663 [Aureococcus anophagefferens]